MLISAGQYIPVPFYVLVHIYKEYLYVFISYQNKNTKLWPLFKQYGNAKYRCLYRLGDDYRAVYSQRLVTQSDPGETCFADDYLSAAFINWLYRGLIVGLAMFYEIGFVLLLPLVFTVVAATGMPLLYVGVPMVAALSVTHCFLPPHPGPTAIATIFGANLGTTLLYGMIITIPAVIVAGPVFSRFLRNFEKSPPEGLYNPKIFADHEMPGFRTSIFAAVIPVILMAIAALFELTTPEGNPLRQFFEFIGNPAVALFISVVLAVFTLGLRNGRKIEEVMEMCGSSIASIAMIVFIIAAEPWRAQRIKHCWPGLKNMASTRLACHWVMAVL